MPRNRRPPTRKPPSSNVPAAEAGVSLVEALIAAALLLVIVIGLIPLFSRSMLNNVQGNDAMQATNAVVTEFERFLALPFDREELTIPAGSNEVQTTLFYLFEGKQWDASVPIGDTARWEREATLRQYSIGDLFDDGVLNNPQPGDQTPSYIHLKTIELEVRNGRVPEAPGYTVRTVQVF